MSGGMTRVAALAITLTVPFLLALANAALILTPLWLTAAYSRPGFPQDPYGYTTAERIELATILTAWLGSDEGEEALAGLLNGRELRHMRDVKELVGAALRGVVLALTLLALAALRCRREGTLRVALYRGGMLTLGLLASIVALAVVGWEAAFSGFHRLFFESGTWQFAYSDTLIRLFPEQFWFDAVLFLGGMTALQALALLRLTGGRWAFWQGQGRRLYWRENARER